MSIRFAHVNIVATDWRELVSFYQEVFNCQPIPPERHLKGDWLSRATGVQDAALEGIHLRLPGWGDSGPTLELFQYSTVVECPQSIANHQGLGHIAFEVDDVSAVLDRVCAAGGSPIGEVLSRTIDGAGTITFCYARDPEGNIIELQHWDISSGSTE